MTRDGDQTTQKNVAVLVTITATVILLVFLLIGKPMLNFFSVDLSVFKIGEGILLLISSISMISGDSAYYIHNFNIL